jgi:signal peptidase I
MRFVQADVATTPPHELAGKLARIDYVIRWIGRDDMRPVDGDPMAPSPTPVVRLAMNALATFVLMLALGLAIAAVAPGLLGYEPVVVVSGSMEPAIRVADVVVTTPSDGDQLTKGAVINFDNDDATLLHRITAVTDQGYRTSGDANRASDSGVVSPDRVRGVGVVVVPFVGLPALWAEQGEWLPLVALLLALVVAGYMSRSGWVDLGTKAFRP